MILTATINEVKRRILFDNPQAVVAVKGDYEVNGIAFAFPAIYEDDFDLSTAVKTVYYKATDGIIYDHVVTATDTDTGYPLWVFKDEINKGAYGDVEFALVCDKVEGGNIVKRWVSMITAFRVQKSIEIDESAQEDNEQTYSERLAYLMTQMANMQATVSGLASGAPTPESLVANMQEGRIYIYTGTESGYTAGHVYYYVGGALTDGGVYGGTAVDTTLTESGQAADAKKTGDEISAIKEDLSVGLSALALGNKLLIKKLVFADGYWNTSGVLTPSITTFHTDKMEVRSGHQYYVEFPNTTTKIIMRNFNSDGTVANSSESVKSGVFTPTTNIIAFNGLGTPKVDDIYLFDNETSLLTSDEFADSTNVLNPYWIEQNRGRYINTSGTPATDASYSYSEKISVTEGDIVYPVLNGKDIGRLRFVTAYDMDGNVYADAGVSTIVNSYTVPANVSAIRVTVFLSEYDENNYAININKVYPYEPYFSDKKVPFENRVFFNAISNNADGVKKANTDIESLTSSITEKPLSTMPEYVVNTLAYKPMAKPSKGYICLVSDDGKLGLATYAIPMVISKDVPLTLAVMSNSEVFRQGDAIKNVIIDAVNNHGCEISQHGVTNWTEYTEKSLNAYFDSEEEFFTNLGLSVKSAAIPSHYTTPLIEAVAGGRFGVVRSGYFGHNAQGTGRTIYDYYDYYTSGEFSNLYGLSSFNIKESLETNKAAIDYAKANNKVVIMYWHENDLTDADKATLETTIDYAKTEGLEFITLSTLKHLIDHERTI